MCCWLWTLCHTIQHRAVLIIFPLNLQTIRCCLAEGRGILRKEEVAWFRASQERHTSALPALDVRDKKKRATECGSLPSVRRTGRVDLAQWWVERCKAWTATACQISCRRTRAPTNDSRNWKLCQRPEHVTSQVGMWRSQPKSSSVGCRFHMKNPLDADADLSPDQNPLVPFIIATAIQLSHFCLHL